MATQAPSPRLAGTVRDAETGRPLAGAVIHLTDLDRAVVTDSLGRYLLRDVPAGPQHLAVRRIGYGARTLHALVPRSGELLLHVLLRPEPIALETLDVRLAVPVRGVEIDDSTAFPERGLSIAAVRNHPLLSEPDAFQALGGGMVVVRPESPSGIHVRGGASDQTAYVLDGIPVFSPYHAAGVFSAWNPDALAGVRLSSASPSPALPAALSGVVSGYTRAPGTRLRVQGTASTSQARLTADGPLGAGGVGWLLSVRTGYPALLAPGEEASYVRGETGDGLAKLEAPVLGGRLRLLAYESENELAAGVAASGPDPASIERARNRFDWRSRSLGVGWEGSQAPTALRLQGWSARADAGATWSGDSVASRLASTRRDEGLLVTMTRTSIASTTLAGLRIERSATSYRLDSDTAAAPRTRAASTPVATAFIEHARGLGGVDVGVAAALSAAAGRVRFGPRARLQWDASPVLSFSGSLARLHQFAQSLRNSESVVGNIFPADLYLGAGHPGVPVARTDQAVAGADYRPWAGTRIGLQAWARTFDGLLHVAPAHGDPFSTGGFTSGSGAARGVALDAAVSGARYGIVAGWGWQHVRFRGGRADWVPDHGARHTADAGIIVFPAATASIRLGVAAATGRRTTAVSAGGFEWEACNLLDEGCEFAGSPRYDVATLGAAALPPYVRVDLGVRKHWHLGIGGRDASLALFGTVTNLFARRNVLTYATDPASGQRVVVEMRPLAPLVAGIDWRF